MPNWILERSELSPGAKLCYGRLLQYSGKDGKCFPLQDTLGEALGVSRRTVGRYIEELVCHKLLVSGRRGTKASNLYQFLEHEWMRDKTEMSYQSPVDKTDVASLTRQKRPIEVDSSKKTQETDFQKSQNQADELLRILREKQCQK